jgi:tetraacyldisaccharide-1-P 4'-kinase
VAQQAQQATQPAPRRADRGGAASAPVVSSELPADALRGAAVLSVSGVGSPASLAHTLEDAGAARVESCAFSDHHPFSAQVRARVPLHPLHSTCSLLAAQQPSQSPVLCASLLALQLPALNVRATRGGAQDLQHVREAYEALRAQEAPQSRRVLMVFTEKDYARSASVIRECLLDLRPLVLRCRLRLEDAEDAARLQSMVRSTVDAFPSPPKGGHFHV